MSEEDTPGVLDLARAWITNKTTRLKASTHHLQESLKDPRSSVETIDEPTEDRFQSREAKREELRTYRRIREDGGIIASMLEARSLMVFGVGGEFVSEDDDVAEWLNEQLSNPTTLLHDIGMDAYTYGYALAEIRETRAGGFGELTFIDPWTTIPLVNEKGGIEKWEQEIRTDRGGTYTQTFQPDEVLHFRTMKRSGRDPVGMSLLGRAMDEAVSYRDNQRAIRNAIQLHGFPKWHIQVGKEDGPAVDDNELRRVRPMFDNINELTKWITGQDVSIDTVGAEGFEVEGITEHDLGKLAIAFMLPVEISQLGGGEGLGSGFPAKLRKWMFTLSAQAHQALVAQQLVDSVAYTLLDRYSPFNPDTVEVDFVFNDPITDLDEIKTKLDAVGDDMTVNERRAQVDLAPLEDQEKGDQFAAPAAIERAEAGNDPEDGFGGFGLSLAKDQQPPLAGRVLQFVTFYLDRDDSSTQDPVSDFEAWIAEHLEEPAQARKRITAAVTLWAASQGITTMQAREQPLENLVRWLERNRNLAAGQNPYIEDEYAARLQSGPDPVAWWEAHLEDLHERTWHTDDKALFGFSEERIPQFVQQAMFDAVMEGSEIFSDLETIPSSQLMDLRMFMASKLTEDGWTISEMMDQIVDSFGVEPRHAETIARSTTQNMVNVAAEQGYRARDDFEDMRFKWSGPSDHRTTDICEDIKAQTPDEGLPLDDLKELVQEVAKENNMDARGWTPHPNCRHRAVRRVS